MRRQGSSVPPLRFGLNLPPVLPPRMQIGLAKVTEYLGFDFVWLADHMLFPNLLPCPDAWTLIAAAAPHTKRIIFGTGVSDAHRMHPAVLAQRIATTDQLAKGRIVLGLGSGEAMNLDPFGIPWDRKVRRVKESVAVLKGLLESDEPLNYSGDFYRTRSARLRVRPYKARKIPLYLAALGPLMQKFAGEVADGWLPVSIPPDQWARAFEPIRESALACGRNPDDIDRIAHIVVALSPNEEKILDMLQHHALGVVWPPVMERLGIQLEHAEELRRINYMTVNPCDDAQRERFEELQMSIPRDVLRRMTAIGDVPKLRRVIGEYVDAGATHIHFTNASLDPTATVTLAAEIIPYFKRRTAPFTVAFLNAGVTMLRRAGVVREADPDAGIEWVKKQQ